MMRLSSLALVTYPWCRGNWCLAGGVLNPHFSPLGAFLRANALLLKRADGAQYCATKSSRTNQRGRILMPQPWTFIKRTTALGSGAHAATQNPCAPEQPPLAIWAVRHDCHGTLIMPLARSSRCKLDIVSQTSRMCTIGFRTYTIPR